MKDRNLHALAEFALDVKAIGGLDVFEVDAAKSRLQRGDDLDQFVRVFLVDLNVEHIDTRKLFEQNALAFHDRLAGQWANVAQAQHSRAVGHHAHQVTPAGVLEGIGRVFDDFFAGCSHAGRIGQCQIVLVEQLLGGRDGDFAGGGELVVFQCGFAQLGTFFFGLDLVGHGVGLRCRGVLSGLPGFSRPDAKKRNLSTRKATFGQYFHCRRGIQAFEFE